MSWRRQSSSTIKPLRSVVEKRGGELVLDTVLGAVPSKLHSHKLPHLPLPMHTISAEDLELLPCFHLDNRLKISDFLERLNLARQQAKPHVSAHVIND
jgi:hypothetical protein